jgi:quinol-cytochrome oxidoreductase complex cytochrome b subunit
MSANLGARLKEQIRLKKAQAVPSHVNFFYCFGGLSFALIILQVVTGVFMLFYYAPEPDKALYSIERMSNEVAFGWLFRNVHRWSSTLLLAMVFSHMVIVFYYKAYQNPREMTWLSGVAQLLMVFLLVATGIILPWDWRAYWSFAIWIDYIGTWGAFGAPLKDLLLDAFSLKVAYYTHILAVPLILAVLLYFHFKMVRRYGISEPL